MNRSFLNVGALLFAAALAMGAPSANAAPGCSNPWTGDCYCDAQAAFAGFVGHVFFFQAQGLLTAKSAGCLLQAGPITQSTVPTFIPLFQHMLLFLDGGNPDFGPFLTLITPAQVGTADDLTIGDPLSNCIIRFSCPGGGNGFTPACEAQRRVAARALAWDLQCVLQLTAQGSFVAGSNPGCTCP